MLTTGDAKSFRSIATLPSNIEAVEAALLFSAGLESLVAIVGPSGWGKSHLLNAVAGRLRTESGLAIPQPIDAEEWIAHSGRGLPQGPAIVDNVQTCFGSLRHRQLLRVILERRAKSNRPTLLSFTAPGPNRQIRSLLPQPREWLVVNLKSPSPSERELVLRQMSVAEGLALSDQLVKLLADKINGNGRTLCGALKRLRLQKGAWIRPRETLRACGLLNPFFADNSAWDLRERIVKEVARHSNGLLALQLDPLSASAYLLLKVATLSESDVAAYLKLEPKEAYAMAGQVNARRASDKAAADVLAHLTADVVDALLKD